MIDLNTLASRVEDASGPSKSLDDEIAAALNLQPSHFERRRGRCFTIYPKVTASLDAAMTLVPEGMELRIEKRASKGMRPAYASLWSVGARDIDFHANGHGKTPALALCAASLRAISSMENTK